MSDFPKLNDPIPPGALRIKSVRARRNYVWYKPWTWFNKEWTVKYEFELMP